MRRGGDDHPQEREPNLILALYLCVGTCGTPRKVSITHDERVSDKALPWTHTRSPDAETKETSASAKGHNMNTLEPVGENSSMRAWRTP